MRKHKNPTSHSHAATERNDRPRDDASSTSQRDESTSRNESSSAPADNSAHHHDDLLELSPAAADVVKQLQTERDEAVDGRLRALADFRNYQRRATENEQRATQSGATRVVRAVLPVLDHFDLALSQNVEQMTLEQLMDAVRIVRDELNKALATQGVERIEPLKGEAFDPHRHEAVMRQPAPDIAPNSVVSSFQTGYAMGDLVLRPAKVAVAPAEHEE